MNYNITVEKNIQMLHSMEIVDLPPPTENLSVDKSDVVSGIISMTSGSAGRNDGVRSIFL